MRRRRRCNVHPTEELSKEHRTLFEKNNPSENNPCAKQTASTCIQTNLTNETCKQKEIKQAQTACAKQTAFTWNETKSTDETCKQHEINQAQPDLGEAMAAELQCDSCRLCKPTRQMTTACAKHMHQHGKQITKHANNNKQTRRNLKSADAGWKPWEHLPGFWCCNKF